VREGFAYAELRFDKCLFADNEPTCDNCPVHCYEPAMRDRVKQILRYAGPRVMYNHLFMAIRHILDGRDNGPFVRGKPRPKASEAAGECYSGAAAGGCCAAAPDEMPPASGRGQQSGGGT
jgi:hypothetical protein